MPKPIAAKPDAVQTIANVSAVNSPPDHGLRRIKAWRLVGIGLSLATVRLVGDYFIKVDHGHPLSFVRGVQVSVDASHFLAEGFGAGVIRDVGYLTNRLRRYHMLYDVLCIDFFRLQALRYAPQVGVLYTAWVGVVESLFPGSVTSILVIAAPALAIIGLAVTLSAIYSLLRGIFEEIRSRCC